MSSISTAYFQDCSFENKPSTPPIKTEETKGSLKRQLDSPKESLAKSIMDTYALETASAAVNPLNGILCEANRSITVIEHPESQADIHAQRVMQYTYQESELLVDAMFAKSCFDPRYSTDPSFRLQIISTLLNLGSINFAKHIQKLNIAEEELRYTILTSLLMFTTDSGEKESLKKLIVNFELGFEYSYSLFNTCFQTEFSDIETLKDIFIPGINRVYFLLLHPQFIDELLYPNPFLDLLNPLDKKAIFDLIKADYKNYHLVKMFVKNPTEAADLYIEVINTRSCFDDPEIITNFLPSELISDPLEKKRCLQHLCEYVPEDALTLLSFLHPQPFENELVELALETFNQNEDEFYSYSHLFFNMNLNIIRLRLYFFDNFHLALLNVRFEDLVLPKLDYYLANYSDYFFDDEQLLVTFNNLLKNFSLRNLGFSRLQNVQPHFQERIINLYIHQEPLEIVSLLVSTNASDHEKCDKLISEMCLKKYFNGRNILHELAINASKNVCEDVRLKISHFFTLPENAELFKSFLCEKDKLNMTPLEYALLPPFDENVGIKLKILLPEFCKNDLFKAIFDLPEEFYFVIAQRIFERVPKVFTEGYLDTEILNFLLKLKKIGLRALYKLFIWEFNINQKLPLNVEILDLLFPLLVKDSQTSKLRLPFRIKLALQVNNNFDELKDIVKISEMGKFPSSLEFETLSHEVKKAFLLHSVIYRDRDSISTVRSIVKDCFMGKPVNEEILQHALRNYIENGIEPSKNTSKYLTNIILKTNHSNKTKILSINALIRVCTTFEIEKYKPFLFSILILTDDVELQKAIIDAFSKQTFATLDQFTTNLLNFVLNLAQRSTDVTLLQSIAFLLTLIPHEKALKVALNIVLSNVWDSLDRDENLNKFAKCASFHAFSKRPHSHDNRLSMKRIIAYRLVEFYEVDLQIGALKLFEDYKNQIFTDTNLDHIHLNIVNLPPYIRYIPFMFFLPPSRHLYRGLKGIGEEAFVSATEELILKGSDKASLKCFTTAKESTWVKLGFVFATVSEFFVMDYFDKNGMLLMIPSDFFNENQLRREVRYETETVINATSYAQIRPEHLHKLFISAVHKPFIDNLASSKLNESTQKLLPHQKRFLRKLTTASISDKTPIKDRIHYYDNTSDVWAEIDRLGCKQIEPKEIAEATQLKHCMLQVLAKNIEDPQLKELLVEVQSVSSLWDDSYRF